MGWRRVMKDIGEGAAYGALSVFAAVGIMCLIAGVLQR